MVWSPHWPLAQPTPNYGMLVYSAACASDCPLGSSKRVPPLGSGFGSWAERQSPRDTTCQEIPVQL